MLFFAVLFYPIPAQSILGMDKLEMNKLVNLNLIFFRLMVLLFWIAVSCILTIYVTRFFYLKQKTRNSFLGIESEITSGDRQTGFVPKSTLVVLGSGGHTTEILRLLDQMPRKQYWPRYYFVADTDHMSMRKLKERQVGNVLII